MPEVFGWFFFFGGLFVFVLNLNGDTVLKGKAKLNLFGEGLYWPNSCQGSDTFTT